MALRERVAVYERWVQNAAGVCGAAAKGNLEPRLLRVDAPGELGEMLHAINDLLDITDAFVRESGASLTYAANGKYFRKVLERGMLGSFGRTCAVINRATDRMAETSAELEAAGAQREKLAQEFDETISGIIDAVAAASTELQATAEGLTDIAAEFTMMMANRQLDPDIETVFLMADEEFAHVSSSLIKQIAPLSSDERLARFVPGAIIPALRAKIPEKT